MDKLRREFQVEHLRWKMLSTGVVQGHTSVLAHRDKQVTVGRVGNSLDWLVELSEVLADACLLDVKDAHVT